MVVPIRVAVISETQIYREVLGRVLQSTGAFKIVHQGDFRNLEEPWIQEAEVLILDVGTASDQRKARESISAFHEFKPVVVMGVNENIDDILGWLEAGACGYISKREGSEGLIEATRNAVAGKLECSPEISAEILRWGQELDKGSIYGTGRLTNREREVHALKALRLSNKEIATRLNIDLSTVKNHLHNIREKERDQLSTLKSS